MAKKKKETTGLLVAVAPVTMEEKEKKAGGGLLKSDRQRYQEGSEVPVPRPSSDYQGPRDYDPTEFEDLDAMPTGVTGDIIAEERRIKENLLTDINNLMDTEAKMIMNNPSYTQEARGLLRPFRDSISPFDKRINSAWVNIDNAASRENIDLPFSSSEEMKKAIFKRVEILRQLQEEAERFKNRAMEEAIGVVGAHKLQEAEREPKQEGGLLEEAPMEQPMVSEEPMVPDEQMEDNYLDFVISESLDDKEEVYLMDKLEADPQLSIIFDKLMNTATEFAGSGPVEGPGSAVSDSIPARLSDGEFVVTAKATDEIGSDNLEAMMKDAEAKADQRQMAKAGGIIREDLEDENDEIKKGMMGVNPRMQMG